MSEVNCIKRSIHDQKGKKLVSVGFGKTLCVLVVALLVGVAVSTIPVKALVGGDVIWEQTNDPTGGPDWAQDVAVDGSGVYVVGFDSDGGGRWRMEKRGLFDGAVLWNQTSNPTGGQDWAQGVAVDGSGVYVVGFDSDGGGQWRMEKRNSTDGAVLWNQTSDPTVGLDVGLGVAVDGSGLYVVGFDSAGGGRWRMEKRNSTDGAIIWEETSDPTVGQDWAQGVALDDSGVYVVGFDSGILGWWRIEKRTGSTRMISEFPTFFAGQQVRMIYPTENETKPLNCSPAMLSDWLASAYIDTKLGDVVEGLDTDPTFVDQTSGAPQGPTFTSIVSFGGPVCNPLLKYAETNTTPPTDRAPIKYHSEGGNCSFRLSDGSAIPGASLPLSDLDDRDMFVIEVYDDGLGRHLMYCYGFGWKGTYAAGKYFDTTIHPDIESHTYGWIIVEWEDTNGNGFVNTETNGDTYTVVATGP